MAKRGSNIYKRKDGRFEGRVPVGYQDNGKIKYKSVYAKNALRSKGEDGGGIFNQAKSQRFCN